MKLGRSAVLVPLACLGLAACHFPSFGGGAKEPVGQVVANVGGEEVTLRDLRTEMGAQAPADPKARKAAEQAALRTIVARKLLAKAAHDQGIDKTPDFAVQRQRAMENLLVQALEAKIAAQVPPPTREEAESFMAAHPDSFAERKILDVDQIRIARPSDSSVLKAMEPIHTMSDMEGLLNQNKISFQRGVAKFDALSADPRLIQTIEKMPANEIFVLPSANIVVISQVRDTHVMPFTGEQAITYAQQYLRRQHIQEAVARQLNATLAKAQPTVRYNKDFKPVGAASASPAPASSSATPAAR